MQIELVRHEPATLDTQIRDQIQLSTDTSIKSRKVELILAALSSFSNPYIRKDILNTPSFIDSVALIERMSAGGKLSLVKTLIEQISA